MRRPQPADEREAGFTLVELMVASIIVGIIVAALGSALLIGFKTTFATGEKLALSNNAQLLSSYFNTDVQSAAANGVSTDSSTVSGCVGADTGINVLRLAGTSEAGGYVAAYRRNGTLLERHSCAPGGSRTVTKVVRDVVSIPTPTIDGRTVRLTVTVDDLVDANDEPPFTFSVTASRRTPGATCAPVPDPLSIEPVSAPVSGGNLGTAIVVSFSTAGPCSSATVRYQFDGTGATRSVPGNDPENDGTWTATIPTSGGWTPGSKTVTVSSGSGSITGVFDVYDPNQCNLTGGVTVSPNPGQVAAGALLQPLTVTFTTLGSCGATGNVLYQYGDTVDMSANVVAVNASGTWTATVPTIPPPAGDPVTPQMWTVGTKAFTFSGGVATGSGSFNVITAPACTVVPNSMSPNPVLASLSTTGQLTGPATVTFQTTGACTGPVVVTYPYSINPGGTPTAPATAATGTVTATAGATFGTWTADLPATAPTRTPEPTPSPAVWTAGTKVLTATAGASTATIGSVTVNGCVSTALTFSPAKGALKNGNGNAGKLTSDITVTATTSSACTSAELKLQFQYGTAAQTQTLSFPPSGTTSGGFTTWTLKLNADLGATAISWTSGDKAVVVRVHGQPTGIMKTLVVDP